METQENQHIQLPNYMTENEQLTPKDLLIYLYLKSHVNSKTKEAFPSLETLHKESGAAINTIRNCIKNLETANKIKVHKQGRKNIYTFPQFNDGFEPFSYKFLYKKDLSFSEKAQLVGTQQYMFTEDGEGIVQYSNRQMAQILNMSESTYRKNVNSLIEKGYAEVKSYIDQITGLKTTQKVYHLNKLEQAIVFIIKNHEDRIKNNTEDINILKQENEELRNRIEQLETKFTL